MSDNKPLIEFTTDNKVIINGIEITSKNEWERVLKHLEEYYKNFNKISSLLNREQDKRIELESIIKEDNEERDKEIERLNNIIIELEKWLEDYIKLFDEPDMLEEQTCEDLKEVLDKLQELKGSDKECMNS